MNNQRHYAPTGVRFNPGIAVRLRRNTQWKGNNMKYGQAIAVALVVLAVTTSACTPAHGGEQEMAPRTNGNPVMEVNRATLDGYRLVSLTLAAGENLPDSATLPDVRDRRNKPGVPVHIYMGHIDGKLIQFWYTQEQLSATTEERATDAPPNVDHLAPALIQLRERDASKLDITGDAIHGGIRFGNPGFNIRPLGIVDPNLPPG